MFALTAMNWFKFLLDRKIILTLENVIKTMIYPNIGKKFNESINITKNPIVVYIKDFFLFLLKIYRQDKNSNQFFKIKF